MVGPVLGGAPSSPSQSQPLGVVTPAPLTQAAPAPAPLANADQPLGIAPSQPRLDGTMPSPDNEVKAEQDAPAGDDLGHTEPFLDDPYGGTNSENGTFGPVGVVEGNPSPGSCTCTCTCGSGSGGAPSTSGGLTAKDVVGVSTAAPVTILTDASAPGVMGIGSIKNTDGANSLAVQETVIDKFGVTTTVSRNLLPGQFYLLDPQTSFNDLAGSESWPPFTSYVVKVVDAVAASHATFEMHYAGQGTVS